MAIAAEKTQSLSDRINATLSRTKQADPSKIAARLRPKLTSEEEEELIVEGLQERVYLAIRIRRSATIHQLHRSEIVDLRAERTARAMAKEERGVEQVERLIISNEMQDPIRHAQQVAAARLRSEARRLSLASIYSERVCIRGEWKILEACSAQDLYELADEYIERASSQNMRGAYYRALADVLQESGFGTVREMYEAQQ